MKFDKYTQRLAEITEMLKSYGNQVNVDSVKSELQKLKDQITSQGFQQFKKINDETLSAVEKAHQEYLRMIKKVESTRKYAETELHSAKTVLMKKSKSFEKQFDSIQSSLKKKKANLEKMIKSYEKPKASAGSKKTSAKKTSAKKTSSKKTVSKKSANS